MYPRPLPALLDLVLSQARPWEGLTHAYVPGLVLSSLTQTPQVPSPSSGGNSTEGKQGRLEADI